MRQADFQSLIREKAKILYRDMPWRRDTSPYSVLVSELMLQQTQVDRVIPKFEAFMARFPDIQTLAEASLSDVLKLWSGLGYNRRAKYLHEAAKKIQAEYSGQFPLDFKELQQLPGIGPSTAGALMAYAFNQPVVFIETNVRTVYFHHFFTSDQKISDSELVPLIEATIDKKHPREFYWALMDYGTELKRTRVVNNAQSEQYKKQTKFKGSIREVRGQILRELAGGNMSRVSLEIMLLNDVRFTPALEGLLKDGLISQTGDILHLTK